MTEDQIKHLAADEREAIKNEGARAIIDIDNYTATATSSQYASHDDTEQAIAASRAARDAIFEAKSNSVITIDNMMKKELN